MVEVLRKLRSRTEYQIALMASACATLLAVMLLMGVNAAADDTDHLVITKKEQSLRSVVEEVLQSTQFADPIASYNGLGSIAAILPLGTTVRIPRPYIEVLNFGQIAFVKGDVTLAKSDQVVNPPGKGALVHNGDIIRTGDTGFVSVSFHSGAQFNLQPGSVVQVNNVRCLEPKEKCLIELEATKGSIASEVTPRPEGQPPVEFSVTTPFLSAAVRGTAFYVDVDDAVHRVGVTHGLVAADSAGSQVSLPVGTGMAATGASAPVQVDLLPEPVYTGGDQRTLYSAEDLLSWQGLTGAEAYQAVFATDPALSEIAQLSRVEDAEVTAELPAGDYFLSVAGIDADSFIGLPSIKSIRFAEITENAQPELSIERRGASVTVQLIGSSASHNGPVELHIGNAIDSAPVRIESVNDLSQPLSLELAEDETWVFRVRKLFGPYAVSAYSNYYQLGAR